MTETRAKGKNSKIRVIPSKLILDEKNRSLESVIVEIKDKFSLAEETINLLHSSASKILEELFQRVIKKLKYSDCRDKYHCSSPIVCLARLFFFKTSDCDCRLNFFINKSLMSLCTKFLNLGL